MSHKKSKIPHSLIQSLVSKGVQEQLEQHGNTDYRKGYEEGQKDLQALVNADESEKIQKLRLSISSLESQLDQNAISISEKNRLIAEQGQRNNDKTQQIITLEHQLKREKANVQSIRQEYVMGVSDRAVDKNFIVHNWRDSWKWISNWCFGLVMFFAVTPLPPELLAVLPEHIRFYVIAWIAFCGMVGRYINQSTATKL